ncbi:hypothetical protein V5O48_017908 [Marasmius crinis-equi]|uniref:Uncharacterized protein n=1 Tax=Marasmius crinis-equi TaxID=585013 RepID=A0ABR3EMM1_9AGAR
MDCAWTSPRPTQTTRIRSSSSPAQSHPATPPKAQADIRRMQLTVAMGKKRVDVQITQEETMEAAELRRRNKGVTFHTVRLLIFEVRIWVAIADYE